MKYQPWPYAQVEDKHLQSENVSGICQLPFCAATPAVPGPVPSLMPSQPYQIVPKVMSDPLLACTNAMPFSPSTLCGKYSGPIAMSQSCIFPMTALSSDTNNSVNYTIEKV